MWEDNDLTAFAHGQPTSIGGVEGSAFPGLAAYTESDGSQHIVFPTGEVRELFRSPDPAAQWVDNDLTALAHGTQPAGSGPLRGYVQGDGSQHVNFIGQDGHVHELYRSPDPAAQWVDNDLTALAHGTLPAFGLLDGYSEEDGGQHVNFIDENGHVHELFRSPDPAAQWVDNDLTALAHGTPSIIQEPGALHAYSEEDGGQHVNFIDENGHVHELFRSPDPAAQWVDNDLTALAHGTPASLGVAVGPVTSPLDGYVQGDGSQHVNFIAQNGHVHELYNP